MMSLRIQIMLIIGVLLFLAFVVHMVRKRQLELKYALIWLILDVSLFLVVVIPGFMDILADLMGIYSVMNMIFFIGILFLLIIIFFLTIALSRTSNRLRELAQQMALYNKRLSESSQKESSTDNEQS